MLLLLCPALSVWKVHPVPFINTSCHITNSNLVNFYDSLPLLTNPVWEAVLSAEDQFTCPWDEDDILTGIKLVFQEVSQVNGEKIKKLQTFESIYFLDKSHFQDDGVRNYLVFQLTFRYFKTSNGSDAVLLQKSKELLVESIKPAALGTSLGPRMIFNNWFSLSNSGGFSKRSW